MIERERIGTDDVLDLIQKLDLSTDLGHVLGQRGKLWKRC